MRRVLGLAVTALATLSCATGGPPVGDSALPDRASGVALDPGGSSHEGSVLLLDEEGGRWVEETLASLTLREALGQLVFQWISGGYAATDSAEFEELEGWVREDGIGGVAISIGTPGSYALKLNALQERARIPLLVTSDFENGGPGMRIRHSYALPTLLPQGGGTSFPPTMAFAAIRDSADRHVEELARITAVEARAVGVHLVFAPVLDLNSNPANPIINTRAFGEEPESVARFGEAYLRGARRGGVLTTAKHFPGHGDTEVDSHIELPSVQADRNRLERFELVPFQRAIDAGVDGVMTAHLTVPALLGEEGPPATFAPELMTGLLREEMGFGGILFTDALRMGAITERYGAGEAAVLAFEAGADVLLIPESVSAAIAHLEAAVEEGRLSRARVDRSVRRILEAKARVGLHRERRASPDRLLDRVGSRAHEAAADRAAEHSIVLLRDDHRRVPISDPAPSRIVSLTFARSDDLVAGTAFDALLRARLPGIEEIRIDDGAGAGEWDALRRRVEGADLLLVNLYLPPRAGVGSVALSPDLAGFVSGVATAHPTIVTSFGSPYVLSSFAHLGGAVALMVAWGEREVSQRAGARALLGEIPIDGVLPITVPPHFSPGAGERRTPIRTRRDRGTDQLDETGILAPGRRDDAEEGAGPPDRRSPASDGNAGSHPEEGRALAGALGESPAEIAGFSVEGLHAVDALMERGVAGGVAPGAALAVGRGDRIVRLRGYGHLDSEGSARVDSRTLWDLASLTKPIATATALRILASRGVLDPDAPVARYLPGWGGQDARKARVTVRDLLLHRSGLPAHRPWFRELRGAEAYAAALDTLSLEAPPGERTLYSDLGFMVLGRIVEAVDGRPLDRFLEEELFTPLGMVDTGFNPEESLRNRIAPTETYPGEGTLRGTVHDENARAMGGVAGHAGLFSSAEDLARLLPPLLRTARRDAGADSLPGPSSPLAISPSGDPWFRAAGSAGRTLGWDTPSESGSSAGDLFPRSAFGHTGFTGTSIWADPVSGIWVVLLTNRVHPTRENSRHIPFRRDLHDAVMRATLP